MQKALTAKKNDDFSRRIYEAGMYSEQLNRYIEIFGRSQIKVIIFEEFIIDTWNIVKDVISFLGLTEDPPKTINEVYNTFTVPKNNLFMYLLRNQKIRTTGRKIFPFSAQNFILKKLISKKARNLK